MQCNRAYFLYLPFIHPGIKLPSAKLEDFTCGQSHAAGGTNHITLKAKPFRGITVNTRMCSGRISISTILIFPV